MTYAVSPPRRTRSLVRLILGGGLLATTAVLFIHGGIDLTHFTDAVRRSTVPAPLLAIGGCAVLVCVFVPRTALALAAGTVFDGYAGTAWTVLGVTAGAMCAYVIGGFLGRDAVAARLRGRAAGLDRLAAKRGPWVVAVARMLPVTHFGASNYLFGTTSVTWPAYLVGTVIGVAPGTAAYAALGASVASGSAAGTAVASASVMALSGLGIVGSALLVHLVAKLPCRDAAVDQR